MKPMLAHKYEQKRWNGPCYVQPKFDGIRALYQAGHFQSRDELPMAEGLLKHLIEPLREIFPDDKTLLDGELYVHGWPLGRINGAVTPVRLQPNEDTLQVEYYVFDRVSYQLPFAERFLPVADRLNKLQTQSLKINPATTMLARLELEADNFYVMMVNEGFEGVMYRMGDCRYTQPKQHSGVGKRFLSDKNNRTWHLLKRKDFQDAEFKCVGLEEGVGKRSGMVGRLICQTFDLKTFGVGSGFTDEESTYYFNNPQTIIDRLIKVKYRCFTAAGIPFNPTIIAVL